MSVSPVAELPRLRTAHRKPNSGEFGYVLVMLCAAAIAGCNRRDPNLPVQYPVTGKITLDDKPLAGAGIMFLPRGKTRGTGAYGMSDAEGKYTLKTDYGGDGAPEGEFAVTISKVVNRDGTPYVPNPNAAEAGERETLPSIYHDSIKTVLSAEVPQGGKQIDFALKSKR